MQTTSASKVKTFTRHNHYADLGDFEVPLEHKPIDWADILHEQVGNQLVVAYLVHDDAPRNPMTEFDCQGNLYTRRENVITDDEREVYSALGLDSYGGVDIDQTFDYAGQYVTLREIAEDQLSTAIDSDGNDREVTEEEIEERALELYPEYWQHIAGPYVVPISYHAERGGCSIYTVKWDGDVNDLPDGVWVADAMVEQNLKLEGATSFEKLHEAAVAYAGAVLTEYASWCEGDCYGCVVETFEVTQTNDDAPVEVEQKDEESVWGFIGLSYATQSLKEEFFKPALDRLKN